MSAVRPLARFATRRLVSRTRTVTATDFDCSRMIAIKPLKGTITARGIVTMITKTV